MRLTPIDIEHHSFASRLRGLDPEEVRTFLSLVAEDFAELVRENEDLRERIGGLESRVGDLEAQERALRETLMMAQALAEDLKRTAVKESEVMIGQAEVRAEKILDAAHRRAARLSDDIREMKALRTRFASSVRNTIETHLQMLEGISVDDTTGPAAAAAALSAPLPRTEEAARREREQLEVGPAASDDPGLDAPAIV